MNKNILYRLSNLFGTRVHDLLIDSYLLLKDFDGREHKCRLGNKNPDKTIYCIRRRYKGSGEGLLSLFIYIMGRIDYADRNGYIPFINVDEGTEQNRTEQASMFNRYFRLKHGLSRAEVYESKNVIFSGWNCKNVFPGWCNYMCIDYNQEKRALLDKYIELTDEMKERLNRERSNIRPNECLGVYLRGTDYIRLKPLGHPVQPSFAEIKGKIDEFLSQDNCLKRLFLVTEDSKLKDQVMAIYGDLVVTVKDDQWYDRSNERIMDTVRKSCNVEDNNMRYLTKILLLSECRSFIGGLTNATVVAFACRRKPYAQHYVHNMGYYK